MGKIVAGCPLGDPSGNSCLEARQAGYCADECLNWHAPVPENCEMYGNCEDCTDMDCEGKFFLKGK